MENDKSRHKSKMSDWFAPTHWVWPALFHTLKHKYMHHDDVIEWKNFPRYWPFVRGMHRWPLTSHHKGQWRGALIISLICAYYEVIVMNSQDKYQMYDRPLHQMPWLRHVDKAIKTFQENRNIGYCDSANGAKHEYELIISQIIKAFLDLCH